MTKVLQKYDTKWVYTPIKNYFAKNESIYNVKDNNK